MRLPQASYAKLFVTILTALFVIVPFGQITPDANGIQNRNGALFFIMMSQTFSAIQNVILLFPSERPVFLREVNNGMYSATAYFWAKFVTELPMSVMTPVLFGSCNYFWIGFNTTHWYNFPLFRK